MKIYGYMLEEGINTYFVQTQEKKPKTKFEIKVQDEVNYRHNSHGSTSI